MTRLLQRLRRQLGESLVVAELARRNIYATGFAGNVPDIDLLAYYGGNTLALQVKAWSLGALSFNANRFLEIEFDEPRQIVNGIANGFDPHLIYVFVSIGETAGDDRYFVLEQRTVAEIICDNHVNFLAQHNGIRPINWQSTHCAVQLQNLVEFENNWELIDNALTG